MAFTYKILTQNGVDNTNIDGARAEYFAAGMRDGIIKGSLNECAFTAIPSNGINLDTGVLLVAGHPVVITEGRSWTFTSRPSNSERRAVIAEITVDNNSAVTFRVFEQLASIALVKNNMYEHENGSGTYQVEIGRFTLTTAGLVEDVVRTLNLITGGSSGMGEHFIAGNITTTMLESGMQANVTAKDIYDANGNYVRTDMSFEIPETAGTVVKVNNVEQANLDFISDPQTQLNNKVDKSDIDSALSSTSENPVQNKIVKNALDKKADADNAYTKTETDNLLNSLTLIPIGSVVDFAGSTIPVNYLLCNGQAVSRTDYSELFSVIGTVWGSGDGSTTFNVPNSQGKVSMGAGTNTDQNNHTSTWNLGSTGGEYNHKLTVDEMPKHNHEISGLQGWAAFNNGTDTGTIFRSSNSLDTTNTGGNGYHNNMQPFITYNKIIRAK